MYVFFFSSRRRHTRSKRDWSSDVCSSDLLGRFLPGRSGIFHFERDRFHAVAMFVNVVRDFVVRLDRRGQDERELVLPNRVADRKSTRLNSSHVSISYAVFCLKKKKKY